MVSGQSHLHFRITNLCPNTELAISLTHVWSPVSSQPVISQCAHRGLLIKKGLVFPSLSGGWPLSSLTEWTAGQFPGSYRVPFSHAAAGRLRFSKMSHVSDSWLCLPLMELSFGLVVSQELKSIAKWPTPKQKGHNKKNFTFKQIWYWRIYIHSRFLNAFIY